MKNLHFLTLTICAWLISLADTNAITLDNFTFEQTVHSTDTNGFNALKEIAVPDRRPSIIGMSRKLKTEILSGSRLSTSSLTISNKMLSHSQDAGTSAISAIIWDGTADQENINYTGLKGLNLLQDNPKNLKISVAHFDSPGGAPVTLEIQLYNNSTRYSFARSTINQAIENDSDILIPLNNFRDNTGISPDLENISSIILIIYGLDPSIDLQLNSIGTDGCALVPDSRMKVVDSCGVCNGNDQSCLDCKGIINGTAKLDRCGVCSGDGKSCLGCNNTEQSEILAKLDNLSKTQLEQVGQLSAKLIKLSSDKGTSQFAKRARNQAKKLHDESWKLIWNIPVEINVCSNTSLCSTSSFKTNLNSYLKNSNALKNISLKLISKLALAGTTAKYIKAQTSKAKQLHNQSSLESAKVKTEQSSCK